MTSYLALGAHRERQDAEGVDDIALFEVAGLYVSAVPFQHPETTAARSLISRAATARQKLIEREIFVAIRYGLTFTDEREAALKIAAHAGSWPALLDRCRGNVELTLKVVGEEQGVRPDRHTFASGKAYLEALHALRARRGADPEFREAASSLFAPAALELRWVTRPDGASELAMLAPRNDLARCRDLALQLRDRFPAVPFLFSGPWPLETFADES